MTTVMTTCWKDDEPLVMPGITVSQKVAVAVLGSVVTAVISVSGLLKLQSRMDSFENGAKMFDKCLWRLGMKKRFYLGEGCPSELMQKLIDNVEEQVLDILAQGFP